MTYESIQPARTNTETDIEHLTYSAYLFGSTEETSSDPIFSLDSSSRTAFLLHHVLGYNIEDAALVTELSEKEFRTRLRSAYLQLSSCEYGPDVHLSEIPAEGAFA